MSKKDDDHSVQLDEIELQDSYNNNFSNNICYPKFNYNNDDYDHIYQKFILVNWNVLSEQSHDLSQVLINFIS